MQLKKLTYLGSLQNEVLSNSGIIRVTFKYLAIATISQIFKDEFFMLKTN